MANKRQNRGANSDTATSSNTGTPNQQFTVGETLQVTTYTTTSTITGLNGAETPTPIVTSSTITSTTDQATTSSRLTTTPNESAVSTHTSSTVNPSSATGQSSTSANPDAAGVSGGSTPDQSKGNTPFSTGALAGAIVGSLIGAAIITFLATWLFFRKRNQRNQRNYRAGSHRSRDHRSPGRHDYAAVAAGGTKEKSLSSSGDSAHSWQAYLPQSADDQTIKRDVKTLFDQIELHVDNYYTKASPRIDSGTREALSQFNDEGLPDSIEALMANSQTILPTIKHCIARTLISRMTPGYGQASLLPEYLAVEPSKLNSSMPPGEQTAAQQAYSQLRLLNAYLHPQPDQDRSYQQRRDTIANHISNDLSDTFAAWQGPQENLAGLKQHERSLVMRAADVATLIMSQPSAYEFWWSNSSQAFVIFPGFMKTTDERGRTLDQPQSLIQPATAR